MRVIFSRNSASLIIHGSNKKRRPRFRLGIDRNSAAPQRYGMIDGSSGIDGERAQIGLVDIDVAAGREMPSITLQGQPANAPPELVLARLACTSLPSVAQR